ncbi:hypothetical protein NKI95_28260 [Mesorhizobium sp. M0306]|uniref:hypothetical protein n=1 Tax=Mesorhizobium sp. M0306 TaxID=2956932 RepID=UPI003339DCAF
MGFSDEASVGNGVRKVRDGARRYRNADRGIAEGAEILPETAGTSLENVVTVRIYAVNSDFYNAINRIMPSIST